MTHMSGVAHCWKFPDSGSLVNAKQCRFVVQELCVKSAAWQR